MRLARLIVTTSDIRVLTFDRLFHNPNANVVDLLDMPLVSRRSDFQVLALLSRKKIPLAIIANTKIVPYAIGEIIFFENAW
jgi:hypothetical protein